MEDYKSDFLSYTNCEKLNIISASLRIKVAELINSTSFKVDLYTLASGLINDLENDLYHLPDEDCDCIDFRFYYKLIIDTINEVNSEKAFKEKFQYWEKAIATDLILNNIPRNEIKFNITGIPNIVGGTFYFDFNVYQYIEKNDLTSKIKELNRSIIYSPIHLEEVYRMNNLIYQELRIQTITNITYNYVVLNMDDSLKIYIEEPMYSYQRVIANSNINEAVENNRVIKNKDRATFFESIQDDKFKYIMDSQDVFEEIDEVVLNKLLFFGGCFLKKDDFKKENKTYAEILHMIYSLYDVLDNIAFSSDKVKNNNRSLKSSIYDIEHLIYATSCDILITADSKFSKRAIQIYRFMKINTEVLHFNTNSDSVSFLELIN